MFAVFSNARVIKQIFIKKLIGSNGTGVYFFKKYSPGEVEMILDTLRIKIKNLTSKGIFICTLLITFNQKIYLLT